MAEVEELLFFDTFAHENSEELNLDLVQFPKPVYVTEVRIIPLGARVQADFPGGVRLGATNPSQFQIEFFVNDLGKPGASTFETLGGFEYNQNGCINLNCLPEENVRKIPTDGLVLRGWYTTITLAVYGTLTANITEPIIPPVVTPSLPAQPNTIVDVQQIISQVPVETEWPQDTIIPTVPIEYPAQTTTTQYPQPYVQQETYPQEYPHGEYYNELPKDPRSYHHTPETDWENKSRGRSLERDRDRERTRDSFQKPDADHDHNDGRRDRERHYTRSHSQDRERQSTREYRGTSRDKDHEREHYRDHDKDWDRERDRDRYKHQDNYRRYNDREETRKRPRTPPIHSPKRPHTPHSEHKESPPKELESLSEEEQEKQRREAKNKTPLQTDAKEPQIPVEETSIMDVEEFEPILSDEDILDDPENFTEVDYDYAAYTNNDDLVKLFIPGTTLLQKYQKQPLYKIENGKLWVDENLRNIIGIADDFFKSSITKYTLRDFAKLNAEIKEEFIHLCEKVTYLMDDISNYCSIVEIFAGTKDGDCGFGEIVTQVQFITETLLIWLTIALDFEMANVQEQPAYKIRHIKCGVKLAEWCCESVLFIELLWKQDFYIHDVLISLYEREYMALSIKLMILKALDAYLLKKTAIEIFLVGKAVKNESKENGFYHLTPFSEQSGYKMLVQMVMQNPSVRLKFALNSIIRKLNIFEALYKMQLYVAKICHNEKYDLTADEMSFITKTLEQIIHFCQSGPFVLSQPRRFLPVVAQFEINRNETENVLMEFFKMHNLLETLLILLTNASTMIIPKVKTPIYEILLELSLTFEGLQYLSENTGIVNVLLKFLLQNEEEIFALPDSADMKSHNLGLNIVYKLQALYHIECLKDIAKEYGYDPDVAEIIDQLHALFCLTFTNIGKLATTEVLGLSDNIRSLLQFFDCINSKSESTLLKLRKSPGIAYIIDLVSLTIIYMPNLTILERHSKQLLDIVAQYELFEPSLASKLIDIGSYIKPFENKTINNYDVNILVEAINKNLPVVTHFSGQLITYLRILHHIGISKHGNRTAILSENPLNNFTELKYKHVILQLFPLDGVGLLSKILVDLCDYFEQPNLHVSNFVSNQGMLILNAILPCIGLLRQMLTYVIHCRNTHFKDLTTIPVLLQTYNLLYSFPSNSVGYFKARKLCKEVVDTLLVYTQPVSEEIHEKDSLNKTLWTLMCGEIIKYTTSAPHTFISGLSIFSELLPLPLPIQTQEELSPDEISLAINLRKLWSAHLHSHSTSLQELISRLCTTTYQPLLNLLRKVCAQLSDLAANSAIMIARGVLDNVYSAIVINDDTKKLVCNGYIARLMNFLACLVTHNSLKSAVLFLLSNNTSVTKGDEKFPVIIQAFAQILRSTSNINSHVQTQECILSIIQSFCDTEITLYQNLSETSAQIPSEVFLSNALPIKEHLLIFINTILDHIMTDNSFLTYLPIVRTLLLLTEHDYGFYHLRECLLKKNASFSSVLEKIDTNFSKDNPETLATLNTLVEFLRVSGTLEEEVDPGMLFQSRKMKMSIPEIHGLVQWKSREEDENFPMYRLEEQLKTTAQEDLTFETLLEGIQALITLLNEEAPCESKENFTEPILPLPEPLLTQFAGRPMFTSNDTVDERLTSTYWLTSLNEETESDLETVACDLSEICRQDLPQEINLIKEIEKLCRICPSDNSEQVVKEKRIISQKDKMRRPFVTPQRGRGFARTIQVRSDLFRSRPPNTSRPPSLHVDDFVALETCGAQPTGPTGYNKISRDLLATSRAPRGTRGRAFVTSERAVQYRQMSWWGPGAGRAPYQ